ncbi:ExeM/NucH family extracellular endonuclease [Taibaiella chishuiensis]|uniref:LTD domain-containing protein n=1 Tax=Taibaiella chishuiensis TaxID=1434707 RepID=A0A2P8D7V9_9BACT|nr:ExeM/NucH family extracellular endonuclease [Taibaiella chishuiensis]PSK93292.1 hypothetical protein B0I18_102262 [Taibaiella chishuiensis]
MKRILFTLCFLPVSTAFAQVAGHVVISEIYGGGGNTGATYTHDFIELYNPTAAPVVLTGWSVQYAAATGTSWQKTDLAGTIPAYGFYLVRQAQGAGGTTPLPVPDATGSIAMAAAGGKVALVSNTTVLSGACPAGAQIVDFVGFATNANCNEGGTNTPAPGATTSAERKASAASTAVSLAAGGTEAAAGNAYDTDVNGSDFVVQSAINPQNTASAAEPPVAAAHIVYAAAGNNGAEPATNGSFMINLGSPAPAGGITVTYSLSGTALAGTDYTDAGAGSIFLPGAATMATLPITVLDDTLTEGNETVILSLLSAAGGYTVSPAVASIIITDNEVAVTRIHTIQGAGATATAGTYTAEAVVTGVYPVLSPAGFYIQEEDVDADANPATSEGIFVVSPAAVVVGDRVRVTGAVLESGASPSFNQAVFNTPSVIVLAHDISLPTATDILLPVNAAADLEAYEGMLVRFPGVLTVTNNYTLGRFGEVGLSAGGAVYQPTQLVDPNDITPEGTTSSGAANVAAINALKNSNAVRSILLDDGRNTTTTLPYADSVDHTLRLGSTTNNLTGIMGYAFNVYRIQPVTTAPPVFSYAPRPALPPVGAANIKVASFNVLNYFNGNGAGGGFPTERGAHSVAEFNRQRTKIISALAQMNADAVGLLEIENDGTGPGSAIQDLVNGLNAVMGPATYSFINDGATIQTYGTDAIRCGLIYKPATLTPVGAAMLSPSDSFNRPPLVQTFQVAGSAELFSFAVNHYKSKGCTGSTGADTDLLDGQSCYNDRRKLQSQALLHFFNNTVIPVSGTDRIIAVGDYNAYYEEDPLDMLRAAGYSVLSTGSNYSYQFDGQIGSLDHAIVSSTLHTHVAGASEWNINAAEPVYLDYNDTVDDGGSDMINPLGNYYTATPYRSSDHDPVIVGLNLGTPLPLGLIRFTATKQAAAVQLNWTTGPQTHSDPFLVERAGREGDWKPLAEVPVRGNTLAAIDYSFADQQPLKGWNLYRIRYTGDNGQPVYGPVRQVYFEEGTATIYPNPVQHTLRVAGVSAAGTVLVEVVNTMSQVLLRGERPVTAGVLQLDVNRLQPGVYALSIRSGNGIIYNGRFVKQ